MSQKKKEDTDDENPEGQSIPEEEQGPIDESTDDEVNSEKNKLKAMGVNNAGFGFLMEHRKPPEKKTEKKTLFFGK